MDDRGSSPRPMRVFELAVEAVAAGVILVVGLLLAPPRSRWIEGALIVAIAATVSTITALLVSRSYLGFIERVIAVRLAHVTKAALLRTGGMGELVTQELLSALERVMEVETIWIVCQDFGDDIKPEAPFLDVIRYNVLERRIAYVYITPEGTDPSYQLGLLRQAVGVEPDDVRLRGVELTPAQWERLPYTAGNVTIYDPVTTGNSPSGYRGPSGVFWYPGADGESFGRLGDEVVTRWAAKIAGICPFLKGDGHGAAAAPDLATSERSLMSPPADEPRGG